MAIYGRVGQRVVIQRLGTLDDVRELDGRKPDKQDREAVKLNAYVVCSEPEYDDRLRLYHVAFLRADNGAVEIGAVVDACVANGGRAP
jgi:hypothetical protein